MAGSAMLRAQARGVLALLGAVALLLLTAALPAHAEPDYPPSFYRISADSYRTHPGGRIGFTAQTFAAGSTVTFKVSVNGSDVSAASAKANSKGIASQALTFKTEGTNTVTVTGTSDENAPLQMSTNVDVAATDGGNNGSDGKNSSNNGSGGDNGGSGNNGSTDNSGGSNTNGGGNSGGSNNTNGNSSNGGTNNPPQASGPEHNSAPFFAGAPPRTAGDIGLTVFGALVLVGAGTALLVAARRRRTNESD